MGGYGAYDNEQGMLLWDGMKMAMVFHLTFCTGTPMPGGSWVCLDAVLFQLPDVRHDADPNCGTSHRCAPRKRNLSCCFREATFI